VGSLERHTLLKEQHQLFLITKLLIELQNILEVVWLHDNVLTAESSHTEFFGSNTGEANSFPYLGNVGFLGCIESSLVLLQFNVGLCEFLIVADALVQNLSCKVESVIEAAITTLLGICLIRLRNKALKIRKVSLSILGVGIDQLRVDSRILDALACH
jgi:hypothetical protein